MITEIGIIAGEIWHYLDKHGTVTMDQLLDGIDRPEELILMSLGWLARENHVLVESTSNSYNISLK